MRQSGAGRVGEHNEAYRKGVVLGLTMAEVGILIIFVLLLLLVFGQLRYVDAFRTFQGKEPVSAAELDALRSAQITLHQVADELGIPMADSSEDFSRLVRVLRDAARTGPGRSALVEARNTLQEIKRARDEIRRIVDAGQPGGGEAVAMHVEQQGFDIANKEGQIDLLEKRLREAGQRVGELPCWAQQGGVIDYLYDVILTSNGIRMRERTYVHRMRERLLLPAPTADPHEMLPQAEFLARTKPLYDYSRQRDCRFFVVVYDATAAHEKGLYKSLLQTVEGHFYKLLADGPAPF